MRCFYFYSIFMIYLNMNFAMAQNFNPAPCKKLKVGDFEKKSVEIVTQIASTKALSVESLKRQKIDPQKGPIGAKKVVAKCEPQAPILDDGGERCSFKCSSGNFTKVILVLYENFNQEVRLLKVVVEDQG